MILYRQFNFSVISDMCMLCVTKWQINIQVLNVLV